MKNVEPMRLLTTIIITVNTYKFLSLIIVLADTFTTVWYTRLLSVMTTYNTLG